MSAIAITTTAEEAQNSRNKMAAAAALRSRFFARKIHKLKKMLRPLFSRKPRAEPQVAVGPSIEELQNAMNEALENKMIEDLAQSREMTGGTLRALEDGRTTLIVLNPCVQREFFATSSGRLSWTFLPSADYDICPVGDFNAETFSQTPEAQTPPASPR